MTKCPWPFFRTRSKGKWAGGLFGRQKTSWPWIVPPSNWTLHFFPNRLDRRFSISAITPLETFDVIMVGLQTSPGNIRDLDNLLARPDQLPAAFTFEGLAPASFADKHNHTRHGHHPLAPALLSDASGPGTFPSLADHTLRKRSRLIDSCGPSERDTSTIWRSFLPWRRRPL
jgi:hypothetical protein